MTQLLVPMAGAGSRFANAGYRDPKPFINVKGRPMLDYVLDDVDRAFGDIRFTLCLSREEHQPYVDYFQRSHPKTWFHSVGHLTEGAACTALLGEEYFRPDESLVVANSDQTFRCAFASQNSTAGVLTFDATESKWSYLTPEGKIVEKPAAPPSRRATIGVYFFRRAGDFFDACRAMIKANDRTNGEFYIAPAINYLPEGSRVTEVPVSRMWGLGTPEDLEAYVRESR